jgi:hypothetical protein
VETCIDVSWPDLRPAGRFTVGDKPRRARAGSDRAILYVAAESGVVTTLDIQTGPGRITGLTLLGDNAHVVALDPTTGQAYFPILYASGPSTLLITQPR